MKKEKEKKNYFQRESRGTKRRRDKSPVPNDSWDVNR